MEESAKIPPSQPAVGLGLTFLLIGLTFALPYRLVPDSVLMTMSGTMSPEVANVHFSPLLSP